MEQEKMNTIQDTIQDKIEEYKKFRIMWDLRARYRIKQIIEEMRNEKRTMGKKEQSENVSDK